MKVILITLSVLFFLTLTGAGVGWFWVLRQLEPTCPSPQTESGEIKAIPTVTFCTGVDFIIPKGQSVQRIGERLEEARLIKNATIFRFYVRFTNLTTKLQAGSFNISGQSTTPEIANDLTQGTEDIWITLLEGWRKEEMAEYLTTQELPLFDDKEFLELSEGEEGYLYPDTYLIPRQSDAAYIHSLLVNTFETKVTTGLESELAAFPESKEDVIIMASIVEREGRGLAQMQEVAGILWHRLEIGMPIQADATLQYIKGYDDKQKTWWPVPLAADKDLVSPYNSYRNPGLPPAPISNPSLNAVKATLSPQETTKVFYIHDNEGNIHSAETLDQHNQNIQRYLR